MWSERQRQNSTSALNTQHSNLGDFLRHHKAYENTSTPTVSSMCSENFCRFTERCVWVHARDSEMSHLFLLRVCVDISYIFEGLLDQMQAKKCSPDTASSVSGQTLLSSSICFLYHFIFYWIWKTCWVTRTRRKTSKEHHTLVSTCTQTQTLITKNSKTKKKLGAIFKGGMQV